MKHYLGAALVVAILTVATVAWLFSFDLLPIAASAEAGTVDWLFNYQLKVIGFLFALIAGLMLYSAFAFRRRGDGDGAHLHGNTALEITWTIVPLIVVSYFGVLTAGKLKEMTAPEPGEMHINVTGRQWAFEFNYPVANVTSPELVVPVGHQIAFDITSEDVIHDFWVPEFRIKQDAVPGVTHTLRITPSREGAYKVRCAEICGTGHTYMLADVRVVSAAAFQEWLDEQVELANNPVARGEALATLKGCAACHTTDGTPKVGPTWKGIYGEEVTLEDGSTVKVDDAYIHESIVSPTAKIVQGFQPVMPTTFGETLEPDEIADLTEFIKSLGAESAP